MAAAPSNGFAEAEVGGSHGPAETGSALAGGADVDGEAPGRELEALTSLAPAVPAPPFAETAASRVPDRADVAASGNVALGAGVALVGAALAVFGLAMPVGAEADVAAETSTTVPTTAPPVATDIVKAMATSAP